MQFINIRDYKTGDTIKALNFGGPKCYKVSNRYVWAPEGGTNLIINENSIILDPLGLVINNPNIWIIVSHQNAGTADWKVTVKNLATSEEKAGVYPFNLRSNSNVYELECKPGTWVMASCGGYKIESSWVGKKPYEAYKLKGTNEIVYIAKIKTDNNYSNPTDDEHGYIFKVYGNPSSLNIRAQFVARGWLFSKYNDNFIPVIGVNMDYPESWEHYFTVSNTAEISTVKNIINEKLIELDGHISYYREHYIGKNMYTKLCTANKDTSNWWLYQGYDIVYGNNIRTTSWILNPYHSICKGIEIGAYLNEEEATLVINALHGLD